MDGGRYVGPMLTWSVITAQVKEEQRVARLLNMIDEIPVNVMTVDLKDFKIDYVNKTSIETLRPLQSLLPCPVDQLQGQCIDIFHKVPSHQRQLLADPKNLPYKALISLGEEKLDLRVYAINSKEGKYLAPMLERHSEVAE